jgi:nicotinic acid mononucleotide adenylyltransferase
MDQMQFIRSSYLWLSFWRGELNAILIGPDGAVSREWPLRIGILSGSFNPLHEAHRKLVETAAGILGREVIFELSISNVDKSTIEEAEVLRRIEQFFNFSSILITRAATFQIKAELFPDSTFVVGYDTAERILSPRYYKDEESMLNSLKAIRGGGNDFLVACRYLNGELKCLEDLDLPSDLSDLFRSIPPNKFRLDISSTELRMKE